MEKLKKYRPHLIAIGAFILISCIYFAPVLSGKKVEMYDMANSNGQSKEVVDFHKKTGIDPLWTGAMFSGMPAFMIATFSHENFMSSVIYGFFINILSVPIFLLLLNLVGFYILMMVLKVDYRLAIAGSIMFAFCSYTFIFIKVGHITKTLAIGFMPIVLAGIIKTLKGGYLAGFVMTLVGLWAEIYSSHLQVTYYLMMVVLIFVMIEMIRAFKTKTFSNYLKACAVLACAAVIALIPNLTNLWATYEYGKHTTRGISELSADYGKKNSEGISGLSSKRASSGLDFDYATEYSYGISETFTLLIPQFHGGAQNGELSKSSATYQELTSKGVPPQQANAIIKNAPTYWGNLPITAGPDYIGAITVFLFVLGLFIVKGDLKWWLLIATVLSITLAWGRNFMWLTELFFNYIPGYNKFRSITTILTIATLAMPILAVLAVKRVTEPGKDTNELSTKLKYAFYITGGICLLFFLAPGLAGDFIAKSDEQLKQIGWPIDAIREDRESMLRMSAFFSLFYVSIAFAAIWFFLKKKIKLDYLYYILIFFVLVDMWSLDRKYMNNDHFVSKNKSEKPFMPTTADQQILQDPDPDFRVYNTTVNPFSDASTSFFHKSIGGYHGAKLKRYQELIENQLTKNNMNVLNMLNAKYVIVKPKDAQEPMAQRNPGALGSAWFVKEIKWVPNADSEMNALTSFDPSQTAIVDKRFEKELTGFNFSVDSSSFVHLTSYAPNALSYESQAATKQLAVFSEIFYDDGWNAYVDGNKLPYFRVNYVLRGMVVPEGKHKIEFKFEPANYYKAITVSTIGSVLASLIIIAFVVYSLTKKSDTPVS